MTSRSAIWRVVSPRAARLQHVDLATRTARRDSAAACARAPPARRGRRPRVRRGSREARARPPIRAGAARRPRPRPRTADGLLARWSARRRPPSPPARTLPDRSRRLARVCGSRTRRTSRGARTRPGSRTARAGERRSICSVSIGWSSTRSNSVRVSGPGLSQDRVRHRRGAEVVHERRPAQLGGRLFREPEHPRGVGGELRAPAAVTAHVRRLQVDEVGRDHQGAVESLALQHAARLGLEGEHRVPRLGLAEPLEPGQAVLDEHVGDAPGRTCCHGARGRPRSRAPARRAGRSPPCRGSRARRASRAGSPRRPRAWESPCRSSART